MVKKINPKAFYDVVVIGAGISGLTSSALFSRAGLSCCVVSMDNRPGGYLAGFKRQYFRFDSSIHWLNNCGPNGMVTKIFKIIGSDYPVAKEQKKIRRFISDKFDHLVSNKPDELRDKWIKEFPHEKEGIIRFFRDAKRIAKSFDKYINLSRSMDTMSWYEMPLYGLRMLRFALPFFSHIRFTGDEKIKKGLDRYFKDAQLQEVFCSENDFLSCIIPISWAYSNDFQTPPSGGSQSFPEWLMYVTRHLGNDVFFDSKVTDVKLDGKTAKGVRFVCDETIYEIESKYVIAACDAGSLYEKMLPKHAIPEKVKENLKKAKLFSSGFTVALGIDCPSEELGLGEEIIYLADPKVSRSDLGSGDPYKSGVHILGSTVRDKSLALEGHGTITIFIPAWIDNNNHWACEIDKDGNYIRGEEYKKLKQQFADILIDRVQEKIIPDIRKHIICCDIATPVTHLRYTGNKDGTMMGQTPCKENLKAKVANYKTPVENLYQSGHWAEFGGGIPMAIKSSINTTLMVLKKENKKAFKLFANYMDGKIEINEIYNSTQLTPYDNSWVQELTPAQMKELKNCFEEKKLPLVVNT